MRPVLVVGPPMVGKTALIHECVFRKTKSRVEKGSPMYPPEENVWLLAPQRLISGMSYVGQWENRLLAILKQSRKMRHVLYFDDLLGLYHAGATSQSTLSVADVLKPYIERREVRLLAEATPEQLRILRERDRGFADLFHVVQVAEPSEEETVRILLSVSRGLEARHGVRFGLDVLPCVMELTRTWQAEQAFPGKAARWLNQLAVKHQAADADRDTVLGEFYATSGLQVAFADSNARLSRQEVLAGLQDRIIGQRQAVETMADVVSIAKARLNDRQRPLGALLFLGPTGVGKTECAKALANYLFSNPARLVRFDMNEFVSPQSVPRLVGTFDQPEGLLTGAVRREPFCVLLLDEIEKAHPDVFDLLLQILGEARLTDALGRTANFSSAVIIMTSNLGTRQAAREVGFAPAGESSGHVYRKAVEEFFRPEFLNRIDRIVPFDRLDRADLEQIAQGILADVAGRAGLSRRRCAIELAGDALAWLVERGCHRTLGARAMRRAVERDLVRPMARQLAAITPDTPTVLTARRWGESLAVRIVPLIEAPRRADLVRPEQLGDAKALLVRARAAIDRLQTAYEIHRPPMQDSSGRILPQYHWYLCVAEFLQETRGLSIALADAIDGPKWGRGAPLIHPRQARDRTSVGCRYGSPGRGILKEITAAHDVIDYVHELSAELAKCKAESEPESLLRLLLDRLALAHALAPEPDGWVSDRALVLIRSLREPSPSRRIVAENLIAKYGVIRPAWRTDAGEDKSQFGLEFTYWRSASDSKQHLRAWWQELLPDGDPGGYHDRHCMHVLLAEGFHAGRFLAYEQGTHLFTTADDRLEPLQVIVLPVAAGRSPGEVLLDALAQHEAALLPSPDQTSAGARRGAGGEGTVLPSPTMDDPLRWLPTVSLWCLNNFRTDLQNGMTETFLGENPSSPRDLMATLPLPPEFEDLR